MKVQSPAQGILYMVFSVFCFAVVNAIAKAHSHIPVHEIILFRSVVSFVYCAVYVRYFHISFWGNNHFWLVMRGLMGFVALTMFFMTVMHMPLASASTIQYLSPVFTVLIATQLNNQQVKPVQWIYFAIALVGAVMIKGFDHRVELQWLLVGVASAFFAGLAYNSIIKSKGTDHPMTIVMYNSMVALPLAGTWCLFDWVTPVGLEWFYFLIMGIFAQAAQYFMTLALHSDVASKIAPWNYFGAVFALLIGSFFFHEDIVWLSALGMSLVVVGVVLNARVK
ncbi:MAG: DMT family transporter [Flavobacteriales bacterium]